MDVLSDVLTVARLGSAMICQKSIAPPWGFVIGPCADAAVHLVHEGEAWLGVDGEPEKRRLGEGDLVLVAGGVQHTLADSPYTPATEPIEQEIHRLMAREIQQDPSIQGGVSVICAKYLFDDRGPHPLAAMLPKYVIISADAARAYPKLGHLLEIMRLETAESETGSELLAPRLLDTLLVMVMRVWIERQPADAAGWFSALRDPGVRSALRLIHADPAAEWTVQNLAEGALQSRATFARRFKALVGETPLAYVARWRMCVAAKLLRETNRPLDQIAIEVGYESAAAFSKMFQRQFEQSPGAYRAQARATPVAATA